MWSVSAKNFGENADSMHVSGLSYDNARALHSNLSNSGEWAEVRSYKVEAS
jgi:hypothetical protein